jgi:hypothetical protein
MAYAGGVAISRSSLMVGVRERPEKNAAYTYFPTMPRQGASRTRGCLMGTAESSPEHRMVKRFLVWTAFAGICFLPSLANAQARLGDGATGAGRRLGRRPGRVDRWRGRWLHGRTGNCVKLGPQGASPSSPCASSTLSGAIDSAVSRRRSRAPRRAIVLLERDGFRLNRRGIPESASF